MASKKPRDMNAAVAGAKKVSVVERAVLSLGQFTANTTVTPTARLPFERRAVIREIHVLADAVPADPDGAMLLNAIVNDVSEGGSDTIVSSQDLEALVTAANRTFECTLATEGSENELTVEAGDSLRFTLVNNSAAVGTNANIHVLVLYQVLEKVGV
jgi:hypothetical protein